VSAAPALTRSVPVHDLDPAGLDIVVTAGEAERVALARDFGIIGISRLQGRFRLTPRAGGRVEVQGVVEGEAVQTCVITLEPVETPVSEDVDLTFVPEGSAGEQPMREDLDPPDEIVNGALDLGALTAEFLALGLDPYPRKPGVAFERPAEETPAAFPFAALARLKDRGGGV